MTDNYDGYAVSGDREWEMDGAYDWRRIVERDSDRESWATSFEQKVVNFIAAAPDSSVMLAHDLDLRTAEWVPQADGQCLDWVTSETQDWNTLANDNLPPNFGNPGDMVLRVQDLSLIRLGRDVDAATAQQALAYTFAQDMLRTEGGRYELWALEKSTTRDVPDLLTAIALEDIGATVREAPAPVVDIAQRLDLEHADWIGVPDPKTGPFSFVDAPALVEGFAAAQERIREEAQRQCAVTLTDPQARAVMQYAHGVQLSAPQPSERPIASPPSQQIGDWADHEHTRRVDAITEAQTMQRRADLHTAIEADALAREVRELTPDYPRPTPTLDRSPDTTSPAAHPSRSLDFPAPPQAAIRPNAPTPTHQSAGRMTALRAKVRGTDRSEGR